MLIFKKWELPVNTKNNFCHFCQVKNILLVEEDNDLPTFSNATSAHTSTGGIPTDATATAAATAISLAAGAVKKQKGRPKELNGTAKKPNGTNNGAALHNSCNHNQSLFSSPTKPRFYNYYFPGISFN